MDVSDAASRILGGLLEARTGQRLATSRQWRIDTALQGPMRARGIDTVDRLVAAIVCGRDTGLADEVVEALLNNETSFFRDRAPFELLRTNVLPAMRNARAADKRLSIWCAGVSTGQEVYSLAMTFADARPEWDGWTIDILGTDVSGSAIARAKAGRYSQFEVQRGLPVTQMIRWFAADGEAWRIAPALVRDVRFQVGSILDPAPRPRGSGVRRFDIVLCRNLLLYFSAEMRCVAFARLAEGIAADGMLMLGAGETVIGQTDRFVADGQARGLYRASPGEAAAKGHTRPAAAGVWRRAAGDSA